MNRQEEYNAMKLELENTPVALEYAVPRAKAKAKKSVCLRRFFTIPVSSIAIFFVVFVTMVNISTTFAIACGKIPLLRELAAVVAFSPSLGAAVENEYVQPIELEQNQNNITMRVEYVIVDQKQLNIFYSLKSNKYTDLGADPEITNIDGTPLDGYAISITGEPEAKNGDLQMITIDFTERDMPNGIRLISKVCDKNDFSTEKETPKPLSTFNFTLNIDPSYTSKGEIISLNQSFVINNQQLTATTLEIYPTHLRLNLSDDKSNSAWLTSLTFYIENEEGERFEAVCNGITAKGSDDSPMMASYRLESPFFSKHQKLTLYFTDSVWLDKDMGLTKVDLLKGVADNLPDGVKLEQIFYKDDDWQLTFSAASEKNYSHPFFEAKYYDKTKKAYEYESWSGYESGYYDEKNNKYVEKPGLSISQFSLTNYPYDTVYLSPSYSYAVKLDETIRINIR